MIREFTSEHSGKFSDSEEQTMECHSVWKSFGKRIEALLKDFLENEQIEYSQVEESLNRVSQVDPEVLMCLDYLVAATDYEDFVSLMLEFQEINAWQNE